VGDDATPPDGREGTTVLQFIERFASVLEESGFARMPARVFVALLATDSGRLTAAELGELLQVSPAAVSGAMRYLFQLDLASRDREPGSRRDVYRVHDDVWYQAAVRRDQLLARWETTLREGIAALGVDTPAGMRMRESLAYIEFVSEELPVILTKWQQRRAELRRHWAAEPAS
jgi:predicted transcriptional regulator